jgi:hypothetical protein
MIALAFASTLVARSLAQVDWDPTLYTAFGEEALSTRQYAEERLGEVYLRRAQGHDGKFFFVQANDPWVLDSEQNAEVFDRPLYRSQRMLYPVLAGGLGLFSPEVIVWSLIVVNILAFGAGTWATAAVAEQMGMSGWWGLSFALNIGFINEMNIDGAGIVAAAAAFGAVALILKGRPGWGILFLVLAALAREAMLIVAAGTAWWLWRYRDERREGSFALIVPVGAVGLWALYLRLQIGLEAGVSQIQEIGLPFVGFIQAIEGWRSNPLDLVVGCAYLVFLILFARRAMTSRHLVGWAMVGFAVLGVVFTRQVWQSYYDISRAVAPLITAFVLLLFARQDRTVALESRIGS